MSSSSSREAQGGDVSTVCSPALVINGITAEQFGKMVNRSLDRNREAPR